MRTDVPITTTPPPTVKRERRWSVVALCVVLAVVAALGAVYLATSSSNRVPVLAIARDVPAEQALSDGDLVVAEVSADAVLSPVPASEKAALIGRRPAVDLHQGGLLQLAQLATGSGLGDKQQQVGVQVKRGQAPAGTLQPGDKVLAVTTPAQGDTPDPDKAEAPPTSLEATVVSVSRPDASGTVVVNLAVSPTDGPLLATRAALGRIALVRQPRSS
ncbi:SAF domain-containing protein [Streptomyces sp. NBC_01465]|uniref:SAF domain-containing protein n=1 Tax=Streptomyces sp. NBC_01465 TaxID=2903878 RepID=UPI002E3441E8|nr:SAF domain-containing protein [Streptomyces sp. NBC_01465]